MRRGAASGARRGWVSAIIVVLGVLSGCPASPLPEDPYVAEVTRAAREERANRYAAAADAYARAAGLAASAMVARSALYRAAQAAERAGQTERALQLDLELADRHPGTPEAGRGLYDAAQLCVRLGRTEEAIALFRRLFRQEPASAMAEVGVRRLHTLLADRGEHGRLEELLGEEIAAAGERELAVVLYYERALVRVELGRVDEAYADLEAGMARCSYPTCSLWDDLPWQGARIAAAAGDFPRALAWLDRLLAWREECWFFTGSYYSQWYDDAQRMKGEILRDAVGDPAAAAEAFLELRDFTDSVLRDDGLYEAALLYLERLGEPERGCAALRELLAEYPDSNWRRKAEERLTAAPCR